MKKILVVDDEPSIVTLLTFNLEKEGYKVTSATDGGEGLELALEQSFDHFRCDASNDGWHGDHSAAASRKK